MKKVLLSLVAVLMSAGILHAAGASSPITGFSWDNVRKVVRFMTSDGNEIQVAEAPKQYEAGKTYNGVALTVTGTNFSVSRAVFVPYRTSDGAWRMRFNLFGSVSPAVTTLDLTISGVAYKGTSIRQSVNVRGNNSSPQLGSGVVDSDTGLFTCRFPDASGQIQASGEIELASKPTWMD
jgi:hypothetical protein